MSSGAIFRLETVMRLGSLSFSCAVRRPRGLVARVGVNPALTDPAFSATLRRDTDVSSVRIARAGVVALGANSSGRPRFLPPNAGASVGDVDWPSEDCTRGEPGSAEGDAERTGRAGDLRGSGAIGRVDAEVVAGDAVGAREASFDGGFDIAGVVAGTEGEMVVGVGVFETAVSLVCRVLTLRVRASTLATSFLRSLSMLEEMSV